MMKLIRQQILRSAACAIWSLTCASGAVAASADDANGLWMTPEKDAVVKFASCSGSLCGTIVWDRDAGTASDTCGVVVAKLKKFDGDAWRDGWAYDPRNKKHYKAVIHVSGGTMAMRAFIGVETLGETQQLQRVQAMPSSPVCKK